MRTSLRFPYFPGEFRDVFSVIPVFWKLFCESVQVCEGRVYGLAEHIHLPARIVYVKFPGHLISAKGKHSGHRISDNGVSRVTEMKVTRRIGAYELNHYLLSGTLAGSSVSVAQTKNFPKSGSEQSLVNEKIDKSRPGDIKPFYEVALALLYGLYYALRDFARTRARHASYNKRRVCGEIAEFLFFRNRHLKLRLVPRRDSGKRKRIHGLFYYFQYFVLHEFSRPVLSPRGPR